MTTPSTRSGRSQVDRLQPPAPRTPGRQGALPLQWCLPGGLPALPHPPGRTSLVVARHGPGAAPLRYAPGRSDPTGTAAGACPGGRPDPGQWVAGLVQAVVEVLTGDRPVQQLLRWLDRPLYDVLAGRVVARPQSGLVRAGYGTVRSVHLCEPAVGVVEATVIVAGRARVGAVAVRLEASAERWRCTRLTFV